MLYRLLKSDQLSEAPILLFADSFSLLPSSIRGINASAVCKGSANIHVIALHGIQDKVWWSDSSNVDQLAKPEQRRNRANATCGSKLPRVDRRAKAA
eukprot:Em0013g611a